VIAIALLVVLSESPQTRWHLPVTIEVTQDVGVKPYSVLRRPGGVLLGEARGTLHIGREAKAFRITKGRTFQMISVGSEGGCQIRFEESDYQLPSCPWRAGFRDHQADIFKVRAER
jgi:hypothetical protein